MYVERRKYEMELDGLVEWLDKHYIIETKSVLNHYNEVCKLVEKCNMRGKSEYLEFICDGREYYSRDFCFDNKFKYWYKIHWDISKAKQIIDENKIRIKEIEITNELISQIDIESLDRNVLKNPSDEPVIVAIYDPINMEVILDGNHRVYSAYLRGVRTIKAYILEPKYHLKLMISDVFIDIYKIHHNIIVIKNIINGKVNDIYYSESGYANSLYRIAQSEVEERLIDKIKTRFKILRFRK